MATFTVMADVPNPIFDSNGDPFSGAVLKAFLPGGGTTSTSIFIDSSGSSPQASITYNAEGQLEVTGNEILPYIDRTHKWGIFANAVDAAANTPFYMGPFDNVEVTTAGAPEDGLPYVQVDGEWVLLTDEQSVSSFTFDAAQTGTLSASTIWQADVSAGTQTRALPASPADGDEIIVIDAKNNSVINKITIGRNGNTIGGVATDYILDQNQKAVHLRFDLGNTNWEIIGSGSPTFRDGVFSQSGADVNPDNGLVQIITLTGNLTSTFTNVKTGQYVLVVIIPGAFTWTHTNITKWTNDGVAPVTISAEHWVVVSNVNGVIVGTDLKGVS